MARISEEFASKWLKASDLNEEDLTLTIDAVEMEEFKEDSGGPKKKVILKFRESFEGKDKGMILNVTNRNTLVKLYGDDTDDWEGKKITLYATEVAFDGKMVESIRIKSKAPKATKTEGDVKAKAKVTTADAEAESDDEIPF